VFNKSTNNFFCTHMCSSFIRIREFCVDTDAETLILAIGKGKLVTVGHLDREVVK
jgi:hypothetical protein